MKVLAGTEVFKRIEGGIHAETQSEERSVSLTVSAVHRAEGTGALDFGGSEMKPCPTNALPSSKRSPGDEFGWWDLDPGFYFVRFNEQLNSSGVLFGLISPLPRLLACGAYHPTTTLLPSDRFMGIVLPLVVCERGSS